MSGPPVTFVLSVDTEEDNWVPTRSGVTARNVLELPRLDGLLRRLGGVRATYFTAHAVLQDPDAVAVLGAIDASGTAEIAAHLHPWNTPPVREDASPRNTMLKNLAPDLQLGKIRTLTEALEQAFGKRPRAFRAGRYGLGSETVGALLACGYAVDSSVTPFISWARTDDGANFVGAPVYPYRLSGTGSDVRWPDPAGPLLELPLSCGLSRSPFDRWSGWWRALHTPVARVLRLKGAAARLGQLRSVILNPELATAPQMLACAHRLLAEGLRYVHLTLHSPSLTPGLSPFVPTSAHMSRLYDTIERFVEGLAASVPLHFATVSEAASRAEDVGALVADAHLRPSQLGVRGIGTEASLGIARRLAGGAGPDAVQPWGDAVSKRPLRVSEETSTAVRGTSEET